MKALKLFSLASSSYSSFVQSIRFFNGFRRSSPPFTFPSLPQGRDGIDLFGMQIRSLSSVAEIMSEFVSDQPHDDGKVMEKDDALRLALSRLASEFSRESMLSLQRFFGSRHAPIISTGSLKLDLALGTGGLPKGRMVELYGREASGKTTIALHIIKEAQKRGGYCAYVDLENALDPSLAESIGVNTEDLLISQLEPAESSLSLVDTLIKSGAIDVIVVDSVAALVPQSELNPVDGTRPKGQSRLMTQALRKLQSSLCQSQTLLIFINQIRSKPTEGRGPGIEVTCGGNALKFYAAVRMRTMKTGLLRNENEITGVSVSVQIVKNKLAPAMKKAELEIIFGKGIASEAEVLEMACTHGVISKMSDGFYYIEGEVLKDEDEAEKYLAENPEVLDKLTSTLRSQLFERR